MAALPGIRTPSEKAIADLGRTMLRDMTDGGARVLVVEDDDETADLIAAVLAGDGHEVSRCADAGAATLDAALAGGFDLVLMDVMLPGGDGLSLCRGVRGAGGPPVIMVSALGSEAERVAGFEAGADDYVAKPFGRMETLARVRAVLRRSMPGARNAPETLSFGEWTADLSARTLRDAEGVRMVVSGAEFDLLAVFLRRPGEVMSRARLLELTRAGSAGPDERTVDVHVSRLRQKIEADARDPAFIKTVRLGGYVFAAPVRPA